MSPMELFTLVNQLVTPLALLPGLWIAARWLPDAKEWLASVAARSVSESRTAQLLMWLVLGMLFAAPVQDLVSTLFAVVRLGFGPAGSMGRMSTVWGSESFAVFSGIVSLTMIGVYVAVVWLGYRLWPEEENGQTEATHSLAVEEWFILLAIASLVNRFVQSIVLSLIWLPVPNSLEMGRLSSVGFFGAWLLALVILAGILLLLLNRLGKVQPVE